MILNWLVIELFRKVTPGKMVLTCRNAAGTLLETILLVLKATFKEYKVTYNLDLKPQLYYINKSFELSINDTSPGCLREIKNIRLLNFD